MPKLPTTPIFGALTDPTPMGKPKTLNFDLATNSTGSAALTQTESTDSIRK